MRVTVNRVKRLRDAGRSYQVLVDGERVGKVAGGKSASFEVAPGEHRIQCSLDGRTSPQVAFAAWGGEMVFECEAGESRFTVVIDSMVNASSYIQLRQIHG